MKKILALAVGMLLIPFTAFGMEAMSDGDMDSITGQSGVAISLSNIQLYQDTGGSEFWYETGEVAAGIVTEEGSASFLFINAIADPSQLLNGGSGLWNTSIGDVTDDTKGNLLLRGDYDPLVAINEGDGSETILEDLGFRTEASVLSIRVVEEADSVFNNKVNEDLTTTEDFAAISIGLPTLEIYSAAGSQDIMSVYVTGNYTAADGPIDGRWNDSGDADLYSLGTLYTTEAGGTTAILGGTVGITSYGQIDDAYKSDGNMVSE